VGRGGLPWSPPGPWTASLALSACGAIGAAGAMCDGGDGAPAMAPRARSATRVDHRTMQTRDAPGNVPIDHPYRAEIALERERWTEIAELCRSLTADERDRAGYFRDPDWSVKDLVGHLGTWMAEAQVQLLRIEAGTYVEEPLDVDGLNAQFLAAMRDQDWATIWAQAVLARAQMLIVWGRLADRTGAADRWVRKSGAEHHAEHLPRLREWVAELRPGGAA
jgi:hypothetical protein